MPFIPNKKFRKIYDQLFKEDPLQANMLLLLHELADERGEIVFSKKEDCVDEIKKLMEIRFNDPRDYAL